VQVPQTKTAKVKLIALPAGVDRHNDWLLAFGDVIAFQWRPTYQWEDPMWLFPQLRNMSDPTTAIGNYVKDCLPVSRGGKVRFASHAVANLPEAPTAGIVK
jgi:hypothetical protein